MRLFKAIVQASYRPAPGDDRVRVCGAALWLSMAALAPLPSTQAAVIEAWVQRYSNVASNAADGAFKVVRDGAGNFVVAGYTDDGVTGRDILTIKYSGADGSLIWRQRYNGPANNDDNVRGLAVDSSGNVIVTGTSRQGPFDSDFYTAKYAAADGALLWAQHYSSVVREDDVRAVAVDGSGNVIVAGSSRSGFPNFDTDYYIAKYAAADGTLLWEKRYNGPANMHDEARAVVVDAGGNVVVTGSSRDFNGYEDYCTVKYAAADGALLWERRYDGAANHRDQAQAVAVDGSNNVIVTGFSDNGPPDFNADYYTAKYAADTGMLLWERRYDGPSNGRDEARAVDVDQSGNVVVTGRSYNSPVYDDYYTAKYAAASGNVLWERRYNGPANSFDEARAVAVDASGNVIVTGVSENVAPNYDRDYVTAKYAGTDGALLWERRYNGPANKSDDAEAMAVDAGGNIVVTGYSASGAPDYDTDWYTVRYAGADGAVLWERGYNGLANANDQAEAVVADANGNIVVTGASYNDSEDSDFYTAKYVAATGRLVWAKRYNGPGNGRDYAIAVATDGAGDVVVTGYSTSTTNFEYIYTVKYQAADGALLWQRHGPIGRPTAMAMDGGGNAVVTGVSVENGTTDYYTVKYAGATGNVLWERRYNGPGNNYDEARAVAVDGIGNVAVTGTSYTSPSNTALYTAKYAAANGMLLWENRYTDSFYNYGLAVAVDGGGNVAVTGTSGAANVHSSRYTARYAANNGALLWQRRDNGPANRDDDGRAIAVDSGGNVIVAGLSYNTDANSDCYTAKYRAADGALLWEKRHDGPGNGSDVANAVAVDGSGDIVVSGVETEVLSDGLLNANYYTAKYAGADGALLWEKRYNGSANGADLVLNSRGLSLGPGGLVAVTGYSDGNLSPRTTYDYATVVYRESLPAVEIELSAAGVHIRFSGVPGRTYAVQRSRELSGLWETISTPTASMDGMVQYIDTASEPGMAFYRTGAAP